MELNAVTLHEPFDRLLDLLGLGLGLLHLHGGCRVLPPVPVPCEVHSLLSPLPSYHRSDWVPALCYRYPSSSFSHNFDDHNCLIK